MAAAEECPPTLAGRRLLIVDDNETNLRILEHQLSRSGATCVLVGSGAAALEAVAEQGFDGCLLDLHMPGMGGDELAARLRGAPATARVPLILLSSSAGLADGGGDLFAARLHKPVRPERLIRTVLSTLQPAPSGGRTAVASTGPRPAGSGLRVLVAEDHAVNAHLIGLYLRQLGHDCVHVPNGREAVEAVGRDGGYDVVLMDAQMPVMGGVEATTVIRSGAGAQPRIIAVTASVLASDRAAFLEAGADDFLTKPVRLATLDDALNRWVAGDAGAGDRGRAGADRTARPGDGRGAARPRGRGVHAPVPPVRRALETTVAALLAADISIDVDDEGSLPRLAHRLKGSSAAMGALRLAEVCRPLEETAEPSPDRDDALSALREESRLVRDAVATLLDAP